MKKYLFGALLLCFLAGISLSLADTGVKITAPNGQVTFIPSSEIDYIEFIDDFTEDNEEPGNPGEVIRLTSNIKNLEEGCNLEAVAIVTGQSARGLILTDNAGSILYYNPEIDLSLYPIGTVVNAEGSVINYYQCLELDSSASINIIGYQEYSYPQPEVYTATEVDAAANSTENFLATYIQIRGKTATSSEGVTTLFTITGTDNIGSIFFPSEEIVPDLANNTNYEFTGYMLNFTDGRAYGSDGSVIEHRILNIVLTKAQKLNSEVQDIMLQFITYMEPDLILDKQYLIESNSMAMTALNPMYSYGYPTATEVELTDGPNYDITFSRAEGDLAIKYINVENNLLAFTFASSVTIYDQEYTCPAGTFLIQDSYGKYYFQKDSYNSFNTSYDVEITNGAIAPNYLFTARLNEDYTWTIQNLGGDRILYYSNNYNNFAVYSYPSEGDEYPSLFIKSETRTR